MGSRSSIVFSLDPQHIASDRTVYVVDPTCELAQFLPSLPDQVLTLDRWSHHGSQAAGYLSGELAAALQASGLYNLEWQFMDLDLTQSQLQIPLRNVSLQAKWDLYRDQSTWISVKGQIRRSEKTTQRRWPDLQIDQPILVFYLPSEAPISADVLRCLQDVNYFGLPTISVFQFMGLPKPDHMRLGLTYDLNRQILGVFTSIQLPHVGRGSIDNVVLSWPILCCSKFVDLQIG